MYTDIFDDLKVIDSVPENITPVWMLHYYVLQFLYVFQVIIQT